MKKLIVLASIVLFAITVLPAHAQVKIQNLLCENLVNPLGLDVTIPRFSWQLQGSGRGIKQTAYEIQVSTNVSPLRKFTNFVWQSGKVMSDSSVHISYKGSPLQSGKRYHWMVRVWDNNGKPSEWSELAWWQTALLNPSDWKAKWIQVAGDVEARPSPLFRKAFTAKKTISRATAYITSHGLYEAQINGKRVGEAYLTPGWTAYKKRLQYQVYDVTGMLKSGSNAIGVTLASGWYRGYIGFSGQNNYYGKDLALLLQVDITYNDGTTESVVSDESWKSSTGAIQNSELYDGETVDARLDKQGWAAAGYDDSKWSGVKAVTFNNDVSLVATYNEPVKKHETFKPIHIFKTPAGEQVIDFGQNLVGWVVLKVNGNAGDKINLWHAEVLDKAGNVYLTNLRSAKAEDEFILKGGGEETFEPHFTFHGFRYIKIEGYPGELKSENFTAVALYSDMKPAGTFSSSNALVNQLQHNIEWGQKGNFLDVPTDCPQRDERLGWTGDAQVFSRTATFNMNVNNFFAKWLRDVEADQRPSGSVPFVVPNVLGDNAGGSTGWADVSTIIPWNMYLVYGDKNILATQYNSMKAWVGYMEKNSKNDLWNTGFHFGDWLFYRPEDDNDGRAAVTNKYLIAQCFYANSIQLVINAAKVLGNTDDVNTYTQLLQKVKAAFINEYATPNGGLVSGTQTAYVLALNFNMLPENLRQQAADRLANNVKDYGNHLTTGFLGTPYLCHVLTRFGHDDVAYKLLLQETYPSWLYPVKMGATTIWERWDGIKPDSTFETPSMNSFNHYSYGAIGDWMYRSVIGIDTYDDGVGYKHIRIMPHIGSGLTSASASMQTYYGTVSNAWKVDGNSITMDVEIPANTTATIYLPAPNAEAVTEGGTTLTGVKNIQISGNEKGYTVINAGSGSYHFEIKK